jgi:glucose/mannose transport system permease protein
MRLSLTSRLSAIAALLPALMVMLVVYIGATSWTVWMSLTNSRMLPNNNFVGLRQYEMLLNNDRWITSVQNIAIYGVLFVSLTLLIGFLLAVAIDQRVRAEDTIRSIYLYPYSMSFVVTGLVWQWLLNPTLGIQHVLRSWGFEHATFDWIVRPETAIYCLVIAGVCRLPGW